MDGRLGERRAATLFWVAPSTGTSGHPMGLLSCKLSHDVYVNMTDPSIGCCPSRHVVTNGDKSGISVNFGLPIDMFWRRMETTGHLRHVHVNTEPHDRRAERSTVAQVMGRSMDRH